MEIPSYQIHNVLKVYSKQVSQTKMIERNKALGKSTSSDKINLSAEGKRKAIIEKVASDIVERITNFGPQNDVDYEIVNKLKDELGQEIDFKQKGDRKFVFNVIDENDNKVKTTLSVEDSNFVIERLDQLAKEVVDKNMEI
ncbi:MAG: hypothetical protein KJ737_01495 [Proteobacteria bacterium]|nr:hypothetical protein [Pseudomonadota bacterium]